MPACTGSSIYQPGSTQTAKQLHSIAIDRRVTRHLPGRRSPHTAQNRERGIIERNRYSVCGFAESPRDKNIEVAIAMS